MEKTIIGLSGKAGSGKTMAAMHLINELEFTKTSFADPLRDMLQSFLYDIGYNCSDIKSLLHSKKSEIIRPIGKSVRQLMQSLGTEWGRDCVHPDVWVILAKQRIIDNDEDRIVFDDVRFENEAEMIRSMGGVIIHIDRGDMTEDAHRSESGIMRDDRDFYINNNGTLDDLCSKVAEIAQGKLSDE